MPRTSLLIGFLAAFLGGCRAPAPAPGPRSIVLVTIDTLRADHVSAAVTPVLHRLAAESIAFDTAITVSPVTLPAHASLLTGAYPMRHGVRDNQIFALPDSTATFASWLKGRGYSTAAFVSAIVLDDRYGLDAGFDTYDDDLGGRAERSSRETLARAEEWLKHAAPAGQTAPPFFLWIHLFDPHAPYEAGSYAAEITAVDSALGQFFDSLKSHALWDKVVLSVTADHGESLGEHGESTHGYFVYDSTIRIPWILKAPGLKPGRFSPQVRILDILPTMTAMAGVAATDGRSMPKGDGVDLSSALDRGESPRLEAYAEAFLPRHQFNWSELRTIRTERHKFIDAPEPELYDLVADPAESRNVFLKDRDTAAPLQSTLAAVERQTTSPTRRPDSDPLLAEKFMSLGYIGYSPAPAGGSNRRPDPKAKLPVYELTMSAFELAGRNKAAEALAVLERAAALDPNVTPVHYLAGTILGQQTRYAEAAAALERAVRINPRFVTARFKLALAYLRLGRHDRAEEALETVLADEPKNFRALHNLAAIAYARGDLQRAEALERQALAIDGNYFDAWNTLGAIYVLSKRPADAVQALQTAIRLNPSSGRAHHNLALALRAEGQANAAMEASRRACALDRQFCDS